MAPSKRPHGKPPKSTELKLMVARRFRAACRAYQPVEAQLARDLGIDPRQLNGYTTGRNYPDEAVLVRFCDLSGCTMDWLYRGRFESQIPPTMAALIGLIDPDLVGRDLGQERRPSAAPAGVAPAAVAEPVGR